MNSFHREDHYLASIAAEVRRSYVKNARKIKNENFILKFGTRKVQTESEPTEEEIQAATKRAKNFWGALVKAPKKKATPKE